MAYRPLSSVTTILVYFVGRSFVSAITQTPASGPFGPATTPVMSSPSVTGEGLMYTLCVWHAAMRTIAAATEIFLSFMALPLGMRIVLHAPGARFAEVRARLGSEPEFGSRVGGKEFGL